MVRAISICMIIKANNKGNQIKETHFHITCFHFFHHQIQNLNKFYKQIINLNENPIKFVEMGIRKVKLKLDNIKQRTKKKKKKKTSAALEIITPLTEAYGSWLGKALLMMNSMI